MLYVAIRGATFSVEFTTYGWPVCEKEAWKWQCDWDSTASTLVKRYAIKIIPLSAASKTISIKPPFGRLLIAEES